MASVENFSQVIYVWYFFVTCTSVSAIRKMVWNPFLDDFLLVSNKPIEPKPVFSFNRLKFSM